LTWLDRPSIGELRSALRSVAPDLADRPIEMRPIIEDSDPEWSSSSARIDGRFVAKFAWTRPAAERQWHEVRVLRALAGADLPLPEVVASAPDPVLLITRLMPGRPLHYDVVRTAGAAGIEEIAAELASFLARLHDPATLARTERGAGPLREPAQPATTELLRAGFGRWLRPDQRAPVTAWCDWADGVLATPGSGPVLVHGDLHGHNQLWDTDRPRLWTVLDFETAGPAEPEFDLRCIPDAGPGVALLLETVACYRRITGRQLELHRIMAWHIRSALGDALWRNQAGVALPDGRTTAEWVDDLAGRLAALDMGIR
jgi:aminoglycoside phosphotransferase (APT) family kinase protein